MCMKFLADYFVYVVWVLFLQGRLTSRLVLAIFACVIGSSFQFGYHTGVMNTPQKVLAVNFNIFIASSSTYLALSVHFPLSPSLPACLSLSLSSFLPLCLPPSLPLSLTLSLLSSLFLSMPPSLSAFLPLCLPPSLPPSLPASLPLCLPPSFSLFLSSSLPPFLSLFLLSSLPPSSVVSSSSLSSVSPQSQYPLSQLLHQCSISMTSAFRGGVQVWICGS